MEGIKTCLLARGRGQVPTPRSGAAQPPDLRPGTRQQTIGRAAPLFIPDPVHYDL
jgi:hypothetical protein